MGGSQLTQLRSKLRDSGLSRTSNPKDPRKRQQQRKQLSATSQHHRSAKLQAITDELSVFDQRDVKSKFSVVTRKGTEEGGAKGMPAKARSAGMEQRKKTLLPMLDARTHSSTFVDHRFGETASHLTPEEKALERFTAERQSRLSKKTRFNLEDEGDDAAGFELTHGGRTLGFGDEDKLEDGGWGGLGVSEGANRQPLLNRRKMGAEPEEEEPERKKTHAEIMEEVVAKSKMHKAERQRVKSADDSTRLELDASLKDLRSVLAGGGLTRPAAASSAATAPSAKKATPAAEDSGDEDEELSGEESDGDEDDEGDSDEDGSTYELNDEELEAALAASSAKSGVDRDLLRKLIGGSLADDSDAERSPSPPPAAPVAAIDEVGERPAPAPKADDDDKDPYDLYVRQLALEPRAQATNRLKTPLELAQEAAETLKKQEDRRLKRQRGERDDSTDDEGDGRGEKKGKRRPQGDDLDDGYLEEQYGSEAEDLEERLEGGADAVKGSERLGGGLAVGGGEREEEGEEEEEDDDEDEEGEEDDEDEEGEEDEDETGSEDEMDVGDLDAASSDEEGAEDLIGDAEALVAGPSAPARDARGELPYTFPCPSTHAEFAKLLSSSGVKEEDTVTVVKRIRTLYHPGLAEGNKEKLQVFTNVLLDHVIYLCASPSSTTYTTVNSLLPPLLTLTHAYPLSSAPHYTAKLSLMHKNLLRGLARGPLTPSAKTWPSLPELTLLRIVGMTWSTSDLSHPVAAPALILITEYLSQCRIRSLADIASGLFLCTLAAQYEQDAKRVVPEALNFLTLSLAILLPTSSAISSQKTFPGNFPCPDLGAEHVKALKVRSSPTDAATLSGTASLVEALSSKANAPKGKEAEQLKAELVNTALKLVEQFKVGASDSEAFPEMFGAVIKVLKGVKAEKLSKAHKDEVDTTLASLARTLNLSLSTRRPLTLQTHRAIPLATYLPKFDEGFNPNRKFDPDSERAEQSKIRQLYRKEKKGAVRELRGDNRFLAMEEQKRKKTDDQQYEKKITKIMRGLQDERAEEKAFDRTRDKGKRKDKARSGRR
ncbi:hypothetical protein JCM11641_008367 [Rhodosporidiobolus odoratus]